MFKRAKIIHCFTLNKKYYFSEVKELISNFGISNDFKIFPEFDNTNFDASRYLPPGSILALTVSKDNPYAFIAFPHASIHTSTPVKPGEYVWYFIDETYSQIDNLSPFLKINHFWVSRICSSLETEDVNYTHLDREFDFSFEEEISQQKNRTEGTYTNYNFNINQTNTTELNVPNVTSYLYSQSANEDFYPGAIPRYFSKPHELSLQGSNNTLINLTADNSNRKGKISLTSGRHYYSTTNNFVSYVKNFIDTENSEVIKLKETTKGFYEINNNEGFDEVLKSPRQIFGKESILPVNHNLESDDSLNSSASTIEISEESYQGNDIDINCNYTFLLNKKNGDDKSENLIDVNFADILSKNNSLNPQKEFMFIDNSEKPNILLYSNDINIVSRNNSVNSEKKEISTGVINIAKVNDDIESESCVLLDEKGDIVLDGSSIYIGNFNRSLISKGVISNQDIMSGKSISEIVDNDTINSLAGKGSSVLLGYDPEMSEPLVLGNSLVVLLKDLININIQTIDELKKITDDLQHHIHVGIPGSGVSGPVQNITPYSNYSNTAKSNIENNLNDIKNNLQMILSKFSKTSWLNIYK